MARAIQKSPKGQAQAQAPVRVQVKEHGHKHRRRHKHGQGHEHEHGREHEREGAKATDVRPNLTLSSRLALTGDGNGGSQFFTHPCQLATITTPIGAWEGKGKKLLGKYKSCNREEQQHARRATWNEKAHGVIGCEGGGGRGREPQSTLACSHTDRPEPPPHWCAAQRRGQWRWRRSGRPSTLRWPASLE